MKKQLKYKTVSNKVLILIDKIELSKTIEIPESIREEVAHLGKTLRGVVYNIGRTVVDAKIGDVVWISKNAGIDISTPDPYEFTDKVRIIKEDDILMIEEIYPIDSLVAPPL